MALLDDGWIIRADIIWHKPTAQPHPTTTRPLQRHEHILMLTTQTTARYDRTAIQPSGDVWTIRPHKNHHDTVPGFPPDLVNRCLDASTQPGDLVLDPFAGTHTTGHQALTKGRRYIGIDIRALPHHLPRQPTPSA